MRSIGDFGALLVFTFHLFRIFVAILSRFSQQYVRLWYTSVGRVVPNGLLCGKSDAILWLLSTLSHLVFCHNSHVLAFQFDNAFYWPFYRQIEANTSCHRNSNILLLTMSLFLDQRFERLNPIARTASVFIRNHFFSQIYAYEICKQIVIIVIAVLYWLIDKPNRWHAVWMLSSVGLLNQ